jgi:hypothetical protein
MVPDFVFRVMYHISAYCTKDDPSSESAWLTKKMATVCFQERDMGATMHDGLGRRPRQPVPCSPAPEAPTWIHPTTVDPDRRTRRGCACMVLAPHFLVLRIALGARQAVDSHPPVLEHRPAEMSNRRCLAESSPPLSCYLTRVHSRNSRLSQCSSEGRDHYRLRCREAAGAFAGARSKDTLVPEQEGLVPDDRDLLLQ